GLKAPGELHRLIEVVGKDCGDVPLADTVGDLDSILRRSGLQERGDRREDLFLGEGILRVFKFDQRRLKIEAVSARRNPSPRRLWSPRPCRGPRPRGLQWGSGRPSRTGSWRLGSPP